MWQRVESKPYHARYEWIHSTKGPNEGVLEQREVGICCRDSEGRERIETRTGSEFDRLESAEIYDPVSELEFILIGDSQVIQFSPDPSAFSAHTIGLDDGSAIVLPDVRQERIGQYVGQKEVEGMMCNGYKIVREGRYKLEYWLSTDLEQILRMTISTESRKSEYRVFDIHRVNSDKSIFAMPQRSQEHLICL